MFAQSLGMLALMIAAVLVFISSQKPYVIAYKDTAAREKELLVSGLNAQRSAVWPASEAAVGGANSDSAAATTDSAAAGNNCPDGEFFYAKSLQYGPSKSLASGVFYKCAKLYAAASYGRREGEMLQLFGGVKIHQNGIWLSASSAQINTRTRQISATKGLSARADGWAMSAKSGTLKGEKISLKEVKAWLDF